MADVIEDKIKNYRTAPFDARFPNTNQTRNCFQNYLGMYRKMIIWPLFVPKIIVLIKTYCATSALYFVF